MEKTSMTITKKITGSAIFAALAFCASFFEFPIFPAVPFLKLDFSLAIITLAAFIYGFFPAVLASLVKELLCFAKSSSGGIGELGNFVLSVVFLAIPCVCYVKKKGLGFVILYFASSCILYTACALLFNRYALFPLYGLKNLFFSVWPYILGFNLIKTTLISIIVICLYKKVKEIVLKT